MVLYTFWNWLLDACLQIFVRCFVFSTPLMKYCHFWYLICSIWASILAKSIWQNWRSRARGVQKAGIVIPVLGGKHYFVWSPCCVGVLILLFSTPAVRMLEKLVSWKLPKDITCFAIFVVHARVTFFDWFDNCDSHPAWGSHFQSEFSGGESLRCRNVKISLGNKTKICSEWHRWICWLCETANRRSGTTTV